MPPDIIAIIIIISLLLLLRDIFSTIIIIIIIIIIIFITIIISHQYHYHHAFIIILHFTPYLRHHYFLQFFAITPFHYRRCHMPLFLLIIWAPATPDAIFVHHAIAAQFSLLLRHATRFTPRWRVLRDDARWYRYRLRLPLHHMTMPGSPVCWRCFTPSISPIRRCHPYARAAAMSLPRHAIFYWDAERLLFVCDDTAYVYDIAVMPTPMFIMFYYVFHASHY